MCVQTNQSVLLTPTSEVESVPGDQPQAATVDSPPSTFIRVLIVDDHRAVRSALRAFLLVNDDLELVGEATGGLEALQLCERQQADVILMDLLMPRMDRTKSGWKKKRSRPERSVFYPRKSQVISLLGPFAPPTPVTRSVPHRSQRCQAK